jgi:hypothetical protein
MRRNEAGEPRPAIALIASAALVSRPATLASLGWILFQWWSPSQQGAPGRLSHRWAPRRLRPLQRLRPLRASPPSGSGRPLDPGCCR